MLKQTLAGFSLMLAMLSTTVAEAANVALDDTNTAVTVMQFTARDASKKAELLKRMTAIRDYIRKQPGLIDNAIMENRNGQNSPHYVGVSRWSNFKNWEDLWKKDDFQKLVKAVSEVGDVSPGTFTPVK